LHPEFFDVVDDDGCPKDRYRTDRRGPGVWVSFDYDPSLVDPAPEVDKCATCLEVERVVLHPDFQLGRRGGPHEEDVAVVILKEEVLLDPIGLPHPNLLGALKREQKLKSSAFRAVGYGASSATTKPPYEYVDYFQRRVSGLRVTW
jgi:hypothetical protein